MSFSAIVAAVSLVAAQAAAAPPEPAPRPANLGYLTGQQLFERCTEQAVTSASYCIAYLAAVHDTVRAYEIWLRVREFGPAIAPSQAALRDIYVDYARSRPADLRGQASSIVLAALKQRFPCAAPSPPTPAPPPRAGG